nr:protein microrchidia 7-like [Tanacetum cinerariifolium]
KIKKLDEEHEAIIEIFADERSRQCEMELKLMKKWQDAMNTIEELRKQIKELENSKRARFLWFQDVLTMDYSSLMLLAEEGEGQYDW